AGPSPLADVESSADAPSPCTAGLSPPLPQRKSSPNKASWPEAAGRRRLPVDTDDPFLAHDGQEAARSSGPPPSSTQGSRLHTHAQHRHHDTATDKRLCGYRHRTGPIAAIVKKTINNGRR